MDKYVHARREDYRGLVDGIGSSYVEKGRCSRHMFMLKSLKYSYFLFLVFVDAPRCPAIEKRARDRCGNAGVNQLQCLAQGCCWDDEAGGSDIACYKKRT